MTYGGYGRDDEPRPELIVEAMRQRAKQAVDIREQLADITGTATSENGHVTAVVGARGLQDLTFDPRAMRMPSEDLAALVVETTLQATEDFNTQRADKAAELGASSRPTLEESMAHLDRLNSMMQTGHSDIQTLFQRFRDQASGGR